MTNEIERTLDALMQGSDITGDPEECRAFLRRLYDLSSPALAIVSVPIARRLIASHGWRNRFTPSMVVSYAQTWQAAVEALRPYRTPDIDPEAEMLAHLAMRLKNFARV